MDEDTLRWTELRRVEGGRYEAANRRGGVLPIGTGDDPGFTPVELLLVALAGCTALDVGAITGKRAEPETLEVRTTAHKVRDDDGSHLVDLNVSVSVTFPEGEAGDRAREILPRAVRQTADRLCTVGRTLQLGAGIEYDVR
jgi:putative redox protein